MRQRANPALLANQLACLRDQLRSVPVEITRMVWACFCKCKLASYQRERINVAFVLGARTPNKREKIKLGFVVHAAL